eukprot:4749532-Pleurochrysis_carterae.AAC.2
MHLPWIARFMLASETVRTGGGRPKITSGYLSTAIQGQYRSIAADACYASLHYTSVAAARACAWHGVGRGACVFASRA